MALLLNMPDLTGIKGLFDYSSYHSGGVWQNQIKNGENFNLSKGVFYRDASLCFNGDFPAGYIKNNGEDFKNLGQGIVSFSKPYKDFTIYAITKRINSSYKKSGAVFGQSPDIIMRFYRMDENETKYLNAEYFGPVELNSDYHTSFGGVFEEGYSAGYAGDNSREFAYPTGFYGVLAITYSSETKIIRCFYNGEKVEENNYDFQKLCGIGINGVGNNPNNGFGYSDKNYTVYVKSICYGDVCHNEAVVAINSAWLAKTYGIYQDNLEVALFSEESAAEMTPTIAPQTAPQTAVQAARPGKRSLQKRMW